MEYERPVFVEALDHGSLLLRDAEGHAYRLPAPHADIAPGTKLYITLSAHPTDERSTIIAKQLLNELLGSTQSHE